MSYRYNELRQCQKCGSYMPSDWERCGRCGQPLKGRRARGRGWTFFILLAFVAFIFRGQIIPLVQNYFKEDKGKISSDEEIGRISADHVIEQTRPDTPFPDEPGDHESDFGFTDPAPGDEETLELTGSKPEEIPGNRQGTAHLTYGQKIDQIHALVRDALKNAEERVTLPVLGTGDDSEIVFGIIYEIIRDDPEIMFYEGCTYRSDGQLTLKYNKSRDFILNAIQATVQQGQEILDRIIVPGMSDFEKELAIHDYIVNNCRYDMENLEKGSTPPEDHNAYGVLVKGKAVCEGYAKAMKLLLDRVNIRSLVVSGSSKGNSHAWNVVSLDGQYYHVDATWDDPVMAGGDQILTHTYFNLTDHDIQVDHTWEEAGYPPCHDTAYNYYHFYGLTVASPDEFTNLLGEAAKGGRDHVSCRIVNFDDGSYDVPQLIQRAVNAWGLGSLSFSVNESYGVVDIWVR